MGDTVYQLKISLLHIKPTVWRRIAVPSACTLEQLLWSVPLAMGWLCSHMSDFDINGKTYSPMDPDSDDDDPNSNLLARNYTLAETVTKKGQAFGYLYDYGDSWEHRVVAESLDCGVVMPEGTGKAAKGAPSGAGAQGHPLAVCLDGAEPCPPEDVGGVDGYEDFREIIADPGNDEYEETMDWFRTLMKHSYNPDPTTFTVDGTNICLRKGLTGAFRKSKKANPTGAGCGYVLKAGL
jgi:hypothetical protein